MHGRFHIVVDKAMTTGGAIRLRIHFHDPVSESSRPRSAPRGSGRTPQEHRAVRAPAAVAPTAQRLAATGAAGPSGVASAHAAVGDDNVAIPSASVATASPTDRDRLPPPPPPSPSPSPPPPPPPPPPAPHWPSPPPPPALRLPLPRRPSPPTARPGRVSRAGSGTGGTKMGGLSGAGFEGALVSGAGSAGGRAGAITAADGSEQARPLPVRYGDAVRRRVVGPHRHCCCLGRLVARRQLRRPLVLRRRRCRRREVRRRHRQHHQGRRRRSSHQQYLFGWV